MSSAFRAAPFGGSAWLVAVTLCAACSTDSGGVSRQEEIDAAPQADAATGFDASTMSDDGGSVPVSPPGFIEIAARGFVFDARVAGPEDGEVVILLHGFPETSYEWRHQLSALAAAGYRAVAPDQRGYSPRARPPAVADYSVLELAQDVVAMADAIGAQRFHLVGHDWGAAVAWVVAVLAADRVTTVNPISVPHPDAFAQVLSDKTSCQYAASAYFDFFTTPGATDSFLANDAGLLLGAYAGIPAEEANVYVQALDTREAMDAALNWYRANVANRNLNAPALGPVKIPTMFTWSDGDTYLCREGADLTASYVEGPYRFEVVSGVDHWVADKAPDVLNALLLDQLARFPAR